MGVVVIRILFSLTVLTSAYLLFVIQPMVGKLLLPSFGGVSAVWTTVMLFFTCILLAGYGYVVVLNRWSQLKAGRIHALTVTAAAGLILWTVLSGHSPFFTLGTTPEGNLPVWSLLTIMISSLAIPCFVLATTSVLLQHWHTKIFPDKSPYYLYVISNIGSLLGLLSYPFVIEPRLALDAQQMLWKYSFLGYAALMGVIMVFLFRQRLSEAAVALPEASGSKIRIGWFIYPLVASVAMLAFTSHLTSIVSSMPFIWVGALGVYLLSFVVAFVDRDWYPRSVSAMLLLISLAATAVFSLSAFRLQYQSLVPLTLSTLFMIGLVCHRELFRIKPDHAGLSVYYLIISVGGVVASLAVAVAAPLLLPDYWEFPLSLTAAALVGMVTFLTGFRRLQRAFGVLLSVVALGVIGGTLTYEKQHEVNGEKVIASLRNFYGVKKIFVSGSEKPYTVSLMNGRTSHGYQEVGSPLEREPTQYYTQDSGLGFAIGRRTKPLRIGVIGLGTGTTAAYCGKGDAIRFYEIDPQVVDISARYFTYITNAEEDGCAVDIALGDARISLEQEIQRGDKGGFDILAIDAFIDDTIPVHLLTREAIALYRKHLSDDGIIAFHISNRYLALSDVLKANLAGQRLYIQDVNNDSSEWMLVSMRPVSPLSQIPTQTTGVEPWTDAYSNIYSILR